MKFKGFSISSSSSYLMLSNSLRSLSKFSSFYYFLVGFCFYSFFWEDVTVDIIDFCCWIIYDLCVEKYKIVFLNNIIYGFLRKYD